MAGKDNWLVLSETDGGETNVLRVQMVGKHHPYNGMGMEYTCTVHELVQVLVRVHQLGCTNVDPQKCAFEDSWLVGGLQGKGIVTVEVYTGQSVGPKDMYGNIVVPDKVLGCLVNNLVSKIGCKVIVQTINW